MFPLSHARFAIKEAEEEGLLSRGICVYVYVWHVRARAHAMLHVQLCGTIEAINISSFYESVILFFLFFYLISQGYA